jgi:uncharacterized membrane protein YdjX (TVP38/TMEM64 family)
MAGFRDWLHGRGRFWGLTILAVSYTPAALLLFPSLLLTLAGGAVFAREALLPVSLGSTAAAGVVFLVSRTLARAWVEEKFALHPLFKALDQAVAEQGFRIVLLTRLSPAFPYVLLNYAYGLTRISFRDFILATWMGMLPGTVLYVYLGSAARSLGTILANLLAGKGLEDPVGTGFFFLGLLATFGVTYLVTRIARRALREILDDQQRRQKELALAATQTSETG